MIQNYRVLTVILLTLAGCVEGSDAGAVRTGPQSQSPSNLSTSAQITSAGAPATAATSIDAQAMASTAATGDLAQSLFAEFCLGKTAAESAAALSMSPRFGPPSETTFGVPGPDQTRYLRFPLLERDRAGVSVVFFSGTGLQCSVGIENQGPSLFDDGSIR